MTPNLLPKFPDYVAGWYVALVEGLAVFNFAPRFPGGSCAGFGPRDACLLVLYVILPTICSTIIDAFYCTDGLDGGVQYYKADLLLPCRGDRHALATIYAAECIAIYVAGIPCCFVVALWYHRGILDPKVDAGGGVLRKARRHEPHYERLVRRADAARRREPATRNLQILWGPFVPRFYWFEVLELARRLFATSFVKILTYRPALRLLLSLLSALAFLKAQIKAEPFVEAADNVLAETLLWIIILNYLALLCVVCSIVSSDAALSAVLTCLLLLVFGVTVVLVFRDVDRERKAVSELVSDAPKKADDAAAAEDAPRPPRDVDLTRVDYEAEESGDGDRARHTIL
ncbi:indole-3-glycerol-phosphate synthase [Aureococcus anophagefferens]|nr:indole-3-glycerol-phosphate synthase [Aureococcus anophagefferens]